MAEERTADREFTQARARPALPLAANDIVGNDTYAEHGYPHQAFALLRREAPVARFEPDGYDPFWAITKHEDIIRISRQPRKNRNAPRLAVFPEFEPPEEGPIAHHLLNMDPPEHGKYRKLVSAWFTPRSIRRFEDAVDDITVSVLDGITNGGEVSEIDFVERVAAVIPLSVLADMLGVPREDWRLLFRWTNQIIGAADPEYQQGATQRETAGGARKSLFEYFWKMAQERRLAPTSDVVSILANAKLDGDPVPTFELLSYYFLLVVAGNETTRNATSGGLLALIENPGELEKLRRDPGLIDPAVEEIVRFTSPVIQFCRTATEDLELRGQRIRAGDAMCLFYPSANRDEDVFDAPFAFRADRAPNPHLGFGIGEHFCLGANLARLELRVIFRRLIERLEQAELAGPVERLRSSFVGGVKHMPIRYRLRAA